MTKQTKVKKTRASHKKPVSSRTSMAKKLSQPSLAESLEVSTQAHPARKYDKPTTSVDDFAIDSSNRKRRPASRQRSRRTWRRWPLLIAAILFLSGVAAFAIPKLYQKATNGTGNTVKTTNNESQSGDTQQPEQSAFDKLANQAQDRIAAANTIIDKNSFSTDGIFKLNVPVYQQVYAQSCEAASLRMALAYRNIKTTDMNLLNQLGYDGKVAETDNGETIWLDPHKQFVGDKDGDQTNLTGYGVFAEPIAAAAKDNGRPTEIKDNVDVDWLVEQIYAGNPVLLWGVSIKIADATWKTNDGQTVTVPMRTHTRLVIGFKGDPKNPDGFYVNDPAIGAEKYWTTEKLKTNISQGIKQAVAVY